MAYGFNSSNKNPAYRRFDTDATTSVGQTVGRAAGTGIASTGKGIGARRRTQGMSAASDRLSALMKEQMGIELSDSSSRYSKETEEVDYYEDMEKWKLGIQRDTQVKGSKTKTDDTEEGDTPSEIFAELAEGLAKRTGDTEFVSSVERLAKKYNTTPNEVYAVIKGESNFDPKAGANSTFKSMFQIGPDAAKEAGIDYKKLGTMLPSEQVAAYDKYLSRWNYDGNEGLSLGLMQAAPGLAQSLKEAPLNTVVYSKDSKEWDANPGWRSDGDGPITIGSINNYYT